MAADFNLSKKHMSSTQNITLYEAYTRYIDSKSNVLSPSTIRGYIGVRDRDFPVLMLQKIKNITQEQIQSAVNEAAVAHSPKTVRNKHGLLHSVLSTYQPNLKINTTLPQKQKIQTNIPTADEITLLLNATRGIERYKAILLAAIGTCRRSEVCAILKDNVTDTSVLINKAIVKDKSCKWVVKYTTKTDAGTRFITLPKNIIDILIDGNSPKVVDILPQTITNTFTKICNKTLGKKYRYHDLRHYAASVMHSLGIPDKYIVERGGWESKEVLNKVYTHTMSEEEQKYNAVVFNYFDRLI